MQNVQMFLNDSQFFDEESLLDQQPLLPIDIFGPGMDAIQMDVPPRLLMR